MSRWLVVRGLIAVVLLSAALDIIWHSRSDPTRASLLATTLICVLTALYAVVTFEILLQNKSMAEAATESARVMRRTLQFSYEPRLFFRTISVSDPRTRRAIDDETYQMAVRAFAEGGGPKEFVFAVVENVGRGSATSVKIETEYNVCDTSSPNRDFSVKRSAYVQMLKPDRSVALCVYVSKLPTTDDSVELVSARITTSDLYKDALSEEPQQIQVELATHLCEKGRGCIVRIR